MMSSSSSKSLDQNLQSIHKPKLRNSFKLLKAHACEVANFTLQWQDLEDHLRFNHSEIESIQKPELRNSFKLLKTHACEVANFALQWQDLEDHFRFIHSEIESKLKQISTAKTIQNETKSPSKDLILPQIKNPKSKTSEIHVKNGTGLILYVFKHVKHRRMLQGYLFKLFKAVDEPGKLVLEAVKEFYSLADHGIRQSCRVILEEFGRMREEDSDDLADEVREEAKRLAVEWRGKLRMKKSTGGLLFLLLLVDFGLVGEFHFDETLKVYFLRAFSKLFGYVWLRKQAPELFRAFGCADKASDYIQQLIGMNKRLEAIRFAYAFELVDQFPPVPLLKDHAKFAKMVAKRIHKRGNKPFKALRDAAINNEIAALRAIIGCIKKYNLGSEYSSNMLRYQIQKMEQQGKKMNASNKTTRSNTRTVEVPLTGTVEVPLTVEGLKADILRTAGKRALARTGFNIRWVPPPEGFHKLNTDGSYGGNPARAGAGGLIRDTNGRWVLGFVQALAECSDLEAELLAVRGGLITCWEAGFRRVVCEVDALTVVSLVERADTSFHEWGILINDIRELIGREWICKLQHTHREGNFCADFLAKEACLASRDRVVLEEPPPRLSVLLDADARGVWYPRGFSMCSDT